ncbi:MAG: IPT/TIG domain-containing protein [Balneolaceae bacterium]|nr:IPT/TIG domain-containing protein [Balneolaceae bacterium]
MYRQTLLFILVTSFIISCGGGNGSPDPEITGIQPTSGPPGTLVTISGQGFAPEASGNEVSFGGTVAQINTASESQLQATVPEGATSGAVTVTVGNKTASGPSFTVEAKAPVINSIDPQSGPVGTEVTITGMNFSTSAAGNAITFNGVQAQVKGAAEDQLITEVPQGATDGPVEVTVEGKTATGPTFNYVPVIKNKILFTSNPDAPSGDYDLYSINPDGTGQEKVFDSSEKVDFVALSNDGTKIAFRLMDTSDNELYIANSDGSVMQEMTDLPDFIFTVSWSPDDSQLVFSNGTEDDAEIYVINADGSGLTQITDDQAWNRYPKWSPDGSKILFDSNIDGDFEIYTMNPDGSNTQRLTDDAVRNSTARWSPDGTEIMFSSERNGIYGDIYRMNADGSNVRRITDDDGGATNPDWSPDGLKIVFRDNRDLHLLNSDGSGSIMQLTNNPNTNNNFHRYS